jgi:pimeloyl-ACP methyl ester carboxylesterase
MNRAGRQVVEQNEVSEVFTFSLGKNPQRVLIEGKGKNLPLVITLHGGPGTPIPFSVGCRGMFPDFTERFLMVYWDQLGCGINNYQLDSRYTVDSFVEMTAELIIEVKKLFPNNTLILFGMSWGSVLALKVLQKAQGKIDGVVTWGQVLRKLFLNEEVYQALEKAGCPTRKIQKIRAITADGFEDQDMKLLAGSVRKYTDGYFNKKGEQAPLFPIIKGLLTSPDYRLRDFRAIMVNGASPAKWLWKELLALDLTQELAAVNVPYYILQGDTDIVTSTTTIKKEIEASQNPCLHCRVIENSGHMPGKAGMEAVLETLEEAAENVQ